MGKVPNIEDYKHETVDQLWSRVSGIRQVIQTVTNHPRSNVRDLIMVDRLRGLSDYLVDKILRLMEASDYGKVQATETTGSAGS